MDVRIDDNAMNSLVAKAVFDGLTEERRADLIKGAITDLLARRQKSGYSDGKSKLQEAFDNAVYTAARDYAEKALATDPVFQGQIKSLFADVAAKLFDDFDGRLELVSSIAHTIRNALAKDRY